MLCIIFVDLGPIRCVAPRVAIISFCKDTEIPTAASIFSISVSAQEP